MVDDTPTLLGGPEMCGKSKSDAVYNSDSNRNEQK